MSTYETIAGTPPDVDEQHELRTIVQTDREDGTLKHMLTEIADGTFVAWDQCARCRHHVTTCGCTDGPAEPEYIKRWRVARMDGAWGERGVEPPLPVTITERDRARRAIMRELIRDGYTITAPEPKPAPVPTQAERPMLEDELRETVPQFFNEEEQ